MTEDERYQYHFDRGVRAGWVPVVASVEAQKVVDRYKKAENNG